MGKTDVDGLVKFYNTNLDFDFDELAKHDGSYAWKEHKGDGGNFTFDKAAKLALAAFGTSYMTGKKSPISPVKWFDYKLIF